MTKERSSSDEAVDQKGLVTRKRINNQTIFDQMLILGLITLPEHEAAHLFIEALSLSGTSIPSVDMKAFGGSPFHKKGDSIAEKRMIFSNAYRHMAESVSEDDIRIVMSYCHKPYDFPLGEQILKPIAASVSSGLSALARHYKIGNTTDPRKIIRNQVYFG
jgi:hypothetical protein